MYVCQNCCLLILQDKILISFQSSTADSFAIVSVQNSLNSFSNRITSIDKSTELWKFPFMGEGGGVEIRGNNTWNLMK